MVGQPHSILQVPGKHHSKLEQLRSQELVVILVKVVLEEIMVLVERAGIAELVALVLVEQVVLVE
jgi:hypothetical protein